MNPASLIGKTIGQYQIEAILGQGGMGAVFRAVQLNLSRRVAVKVILENLSDKPGYLERFNREAQLVAALDHPHIVTVYDFGMEQVDSLGEVMFVAMKLLEGGSLERRIRDRQGVPYSLGEVNDLIGGICSALDHAHQNGVIHRDIKPANIVFDRATGEGRAYLVDFGIAKAVGGGSLSLTNAGVAMGSPYYMPPEQWKNEEIKPASDQYALAITIYNMLTGRLPFEADSTAALMYKHLQDDPTPIQNIRPNLPLQTMMVLGRAMRKNPDERWPTCTAFADALYESADSSLTNPFINTPAEGRPATVPHRPVSRPIRPAAFNSMEPGSRGVASPGSKSDLNLSNYLIPNDQPIPAASNSIRVLIGGLIGMAIVVVFILLMAMFSGSGESEGATETARAVAFIPTHTPLPTETLSPRQVALATREILITVTAAQLTLNAEFTLIAAMDETATATLATPTPLPTETPIPPSLTPVPTLTSIPPSLTPLPTLTPVPPTETALPTETPVPPTETPAPTLTPVPPTETAAPTSTPVPPSATPVPPTETAAPTSTPVPPTETAAPTAIPVSMITTTTLPVFLAQDFSASADGLLLQRGNPWQITPVDGNSAYCNAATDPASGGADLISWGEENWENYIVEVRVRFDQPETVLELYTRINDPNNLYSAYVNAAAQIVNFVYFTPDAGGQSLGGKAATLTPGQWYTLRVEQDGDTARYWLDGTLIAENNEPRPRISGPAAVRVPTGQRVCIDDITVWGFAPVQTVSVSAPTATPTSASENASPAATSDLALMFEQDFTGSNTLGMFVQRGNPWDTILIQGDSAYCNRANPSAADGEADILTFGSERWNDYIVELDVFFADQAIVEVYTRYNSTNRLYSAYLDGQNQAAVLAHFDPEVENAVLAVKAYTFARSQRYTVRVELTGSDVRYWIDGQLVVEGSSIDQVAAGGAAVRVASRSRICIDNVRVWSYTAPVGAFYATLVTNSANLRTGPTTNFTSVGALARGDRVTVVGRNAGGDWLRVRTRYGLEAWLATSLVDIQGDINGLPVE